VGEKKMKLKDASKRLRSIRNGQPKITLKQAREQVQFRKRIIRLRRCLDDIEKELIKAHQERKVKITPAEQKLLNGIINGTPILVSLVSIL
jgi:hypothetical protein